MIQKIIFLFIGCLFWSCSQQKFKQQNTMVPQRVVSFGITDINFISSPGSTPHIRYDEGFKGVIVFNIDGNTFRAFDLGCPYIHPNECNVPMELNQAQEMYCANCANDDITFTQFRTGVTIGTGENEKTYYLREYRAFLENGVVRVTNF